MVDPELECFHITVTAARREAICDRCISSMVCIAGYDDRPRCHVDFNRVDDGQGNVSGY